MHLLLILIRAYVKIHVSSGQRIGFPLLWGRDVDKPPVPHGSVATVPIIVLNTVHVKPAGYSSTSLDHVVWYFFLFLPPKYVLVVVASDWTRRISWYMHGGGLDDLLDTTLWFYEPVTFCTQGWCWNGDFSYSLLLICGTSQNEGLSKAAWFNSRWDVM